VQNAVPFHIPSALFPVEHRFLDLDGVRIRYVDEGAGDTLLLLRLITEAAKTGRPTSAAT
jgi:hypothetical protein